MKIVILGAPGAGKGTLAKRLASHFDIAHISTGDIMRKHMRKGTPTGKQIEADMNRGLLIPDDLAEAILREWLDTEYGKQGLGHGFGIDDGFILDGFPRTLVQAERLPGIVGTLDLVIQINIADEIIVQRMSSRYVCSHCGTPYSFKNSDDLPNNCAKCAKGALVRRADDAPEAVERRLSIFHEQTEPIIEYYRERDLLMVLDGTKATDELVKIICDTRQGITSSQHRGA